MNRLYKVIEVISALVLQPTCTRKRVKLPTLVEVCPPRIYGQLSPTYISYAF